MNPHQWQLWWLIILVVIGASVLVFMLLYRQRHKTNIETDLLLKQMRLTSRLRAVLDMQKGRLDEFDAYHQRQFEEWERVRTDVRTRFKYEIGDMDLPPEPAVDLRGLFDDLQE